MKFGLKLGIFFWLKNSAFTPLIYLYFYVFSYQFCYLFRGLTNVNLRRWLRVGRIFFLLPLRTLLFLFLCTSILRGRSSCNTLCMFLSNIISILTCNRTITLIRKNTYVQEEGKVLSFKSVDLVDILSENIWIWISPLCQIWLSRLCHWTVAILPRWTLKV